MKLPPPSNEVTGEPSFRWRRISFFGIVGYCLLMMPLLSLLPPLDDNDVKIAQGLLDLAGFAFLTYAGGAGAQDIVAMWTTRSARPYAANPPSVDPAPPAPNVVVTDRATVVGAPVNVQPDHVPPPDMQGN